MSDSVPTISIPAATSKYGLDIRRLRGAVFTNRNGDPLGDPAADLVQDDETLARWAQRQAQATS